MSADTKEKELLYLKDGFKLGRELNRGIERPGRAFLLEVGLPSPLKYPWKGFELTIALIAKP